MARKLIWETEALDQIDAAAAYVEENWGKKTALKFVRNLRQTARLLPKFPKRGRQSGLSPEVWHINVLPYHWLYYRISPEFIQIVYLFDARQDPEKNPFE